MQAIEIETMISPQGNIVLPLDCKIYYGRHARMILLLTDDQVEHPATQSHVRRRSPPPQFAGKARDRGDVMSSIPPVDWGMEE